MNMLIWILTTLFAATPLTDFAAGQLYLGTFEGGLYEHGSNAMPADHAARMPAIAPINGRIIVVGIGMSNWTDELCGRLFPENGPCQFNSFMVQAAAGQAAGTVNPALTLVDCARYGADAKKWVSDAFGMYSTCLNTFLAPKGISESEVQIVLFKDANGTPQTPLSSTTVCKPQPAPQWGIARSNPDACSYEQYLGMIARYVKTRYPNCIQMFLHSRVYSGYANLLGKTLNPEPYAYEYGFATKWAIQAQVSQERGGSADPVVGDLSAAPWLAWGAYLWAPACPVTRSDGVCYNQTDFQSDGTHPSFGTGVPKVASQMMSFYLTSPQTPWFRP